MVFPIFCCEPTRLYSKERQGRERQKNERKKNYKKNCHGSLSSKVKDLSWLAIKPKQKFDQFIRWSTKFQPFKKNETFHTLFVASQCKKIKLAIHQHFL
jgi:hypothetical protein